MRHSLSSDVVLVVDDEAFARLFAVQVFLDAGLTVLEAADAAEGIEMLDRNDDVGLVFTDINMPGELDGIGLVRHVQATRPHVPVLLTSGLAPAGTLVDGVPILSKPYTAQLLTEAIEQLSTQPPPSA